MAESGPSRWTVRARWVFPVAGPPLEGGTVTVQGHRILAVQPSSPGSPARDLGDVAILPGLVNAHTHLDLSGLKGRLPPGDDFFSWLRGVIGYRRMLAPDQVTADIRAGLAESLSFGTTLLGDISSQGYGWAVLVSAPVWSVVFYEVLGLPRARARQAWRDARAWLSSHRATATCRPGLSPHAPYSVRASVFRAVASWSARHNLPVATHLAETRAEEQLLRTRNGPFREFLTELGAWDPQGLVPGQAAVVRLLAGLPQATFVHANYLAASALPPGGRIVYCPRTHAAFGHASHPFREYLAAGVSVALGTDSLASNPDLNVLGEARFLHKRHPDLAGEALLRMATVAGAEALGWQEQTGSLVPGKSADLVVLPIEPRTAKNPHDLLWESSARPIRVLWRGRWIHGHLRPET